MTTVAFEAPRIARSYPGLRGDAAARRTARLHYPSVTSNRPKRSGDEEDAEAEAVAGERRQPRDEAPVLAVVGEGEAVRAVGVIHALHEFTERTEEVVHLLRLEEHLTLGFEHQTRAWSCGDDVGTAGTRPGDSDLETLCLEI